ncbi:MAG: hypothetical protein O3A05_03705 [Proteobacteria bacterium]|nr:hypothetical protein [Pseudomonadota bacterium]MDA1011584.1 hypothetical protein [Pseudomonadota bacterium]
MVFSQLDLAHQIDALFDQCIDLECDSVGDLHVVRGTLDAKSAVIVAFDFNLAGGSIGPSEASQLHVAITTAEQMTLPLIMMLNTGGVRVPEGANSLGAFRFVFRELLDAKVRGVQVLSLVTQQCYGGGSMLAAISDVVLVNAQSQISMSGPRLIQALNQYVEGDDVTTDRVRLVLCGKSRAATSDRFQLVEDNIEGYRGGIKHLLSSSENPGSSIKQSLLNLERRFAENGVIPSDRFTAKASIHPSIDKSKFGYGNSWSGRASLFTLDTQVGSATATYALVTDFFADAESIYDLVKAIDALPNSVSNINIFIDCPSHSPSLSDETLLLSEYLATLALGVRLKHLSGVNVHVLVIGSSGGGIFAALSAAASRMSMLSVGSVQVLPRAALSAMRRPDDKLITTKQLLESGSVDDMLEDLSSVLS